MNHCSTLMNFVNPLRNYVNGRWLDVLKDVYFIHKIWKWFIIWRVHREPDVKQWWQPITTPSNRQHWPGFIFCGTWYVMEFLKRSELMNDDWKLHQLHAVQVKVHSQRMKQRDFGKVEPQVLDWHTIQILWK